MEEIERFYFEEQKEKKAISHSSMNRRSRCGKRGRVRLPHDNLTKKGLENMNGKCETYRLNSPMTWSEFRAMPEEIQKTYIKLLRQKFDAPEGRITDMMGVAQYTASRYFNKIGLGVGTRSKTRSWDQESWNAWIDGRKTEVSASEAVPVIEDESVSNIPESEPQPKDGLQHENDAVCEALLDEFEQSESDLPEEKMIASAVPITPVNGTLSFEGNAEEILNTLRILLCGAAAKVNVSFEILHNSIYEGGT